MDRSGVVYLWIIVMFLSTVWTLILTAPIHCRGSIGEQMTKSYISPNLFWWRNKFIYILDGLRGNTFSTTFWWTIPLKWMNVFLQLPSLFLFCSFFLHPGNALPPSDQGRTLSDGADKSHSAPLQKRSSAAVWDLAHVQWSSPACKCTQWIETWGNCILQQLVCMFIICSRYSADFIALHICINSRKAWELLRSWGTEISSAGSQASMRAVCRECFTG